MTTGKSALILGATGQTGQKLLQELLEDPTFTRVGEYGRTVTPQESIKAGKEKLEQKTIDFEKLDEAGLKEGKWDVVFITLGTTRAKAGSAAAFERIDREYVINAARAASLNDPNHAQRVVYLSSTGSDPKSSFLYPRSKGLTELGLAGLGYSDTIIFRPGLLTETKRPDGRLIESLADRVLNLRTSWARSYSSPVGTVAKAMRVAGELGSSSLPQAAAQHSVKEGGSTPFTSLDNLGTRVLAEGA